jgi:hypothetical protein
MTTITLDIPEHLLPLLDTIDDELPIVLEMGMSRLAPVSIKAYMEAIDFLTQDPTPEMMARFHFSEDVEARIHELLEKNRDDRLSMAEEVELERLGQLEEQLQLVKAKALTESNSD